LFLGVGITSYVEGRVFSREEDEVGNDFAIIDGLTGYPKAWCVSSVCFGMGEFSRRRRLLAAEASRAGVDDLGAWNRP
jgi:hypothetical protein